MPYDGFISYSHAADGRLAPAVQRGLHRLAKPWHRRRALWIFRDQTGLSVTPALWTSIQEALDGSQHFVLLASPEAARSPWVNREIEHWVATKSPDEILPVVTDGEWRWDPDTGDFAEDSTAVPDALRGVFAEEPLYLDLRWARNDVHVSLQHARFRDAIAQLAAPMHGVSKDELEGEDVRQHRRARRLWSVAAGALMLLTFVAILTGALAVRNADRANAAATEARRQQQLVLEQRGTAERAAEEAHRQEELARQHEGRAKAAAAEVRRQESLAEKQKILVARASTEVGRQQANARRQRALADGAAARAREQEALAQRERAAARRSAEEARRQQQRAVEQDKRARDQEKRADTAAEEARRQERAAKEQEQRAREAAGEAGRQQRKAISQRLANRATATIEDDPGTALRLGLAAVSVEPDVETRGALTRLVTSTHFAGLLKGSVDVAYGPNGIVALTTLKYAVSLWDVTGPGEPRLLSTIDDAATTVSLSPDGRILGLATETGPVLWDVRKPADPHRIGGFPGLGPHHDMTFSPDGRTVAVTGDRSSLWDVTGGIADTPLADLPGRPQSLLFSADGRTLVVPGTGEVWDISDRTKPSPLARLPEEYQPIAISRASPVLATEDHHGFITMWDLSNPAEPVERRSLIEHRDGSATRVALDPTGTILAVADTRRKLTLWDLTAPQTPRRMHSTKLSQDLHTLEFSPDGRTLLGGAHVGTTVWKVTAAGAPAPVAGLAAPDTVLATAYRAKGAQLVGVDRAARVTIWDTTPAGRAARPTTLQLPGGKGATWSAAVTPDGGVVATIDEKQRVTLFDVTRPDRVRTLGGFDVRHPNSGAMVFSPDGRILAVSGEDAVRLWDVSDREDPTLVGTVEFADVRNSAVAFSPDGNVMAVRHEGTVTLVDVSEPSRPTTYADLPTGWDTAMTVAFSPDGRTLAAGVGSSTRGGIIMWDVSGTAAPRQLATLPTLDNGLLGVLAFAPDGRTLAAGVTYAEVMLWDVTDRTSPIHVPAAGRTSKHVSALSFSPDGHTLAVASDKEYAGGGVALWDYSQLKAVRADPVAYACAVTGRGLNAEEWTRYVPELPYRRTCGG